MQLACVKGLLNESHETLCCYLQPLSEIVNKYMSFHLQYLMCKKKHCKSHLLLHTK